jgi:DNA polymerase-4
MLRLRFADYTRAARSHTMRRPTARTATVLAVARELVAASQPLIAERGLTLIGVALTNLVDDRPFQLELPFVPDESAPLDATLDEIRERFGSAAVTRAVLLGRRDLAMPLLPD